MYSGVCIGGPAHGRMISVKSNYFSMQMIPPFYAATSHKQLVSDDPREAVAYERFDYLHSEEYTEWGEVAIVFIWSKMGALDRQRREKFIATALTGDGKVRKLTNKNIKILWPDAPKEWKAINDDQR